MANAAAHREPGLSAIRWSRLLDLVLDILEVPVPDIEFLTRPPALHIKSSVEPCYDPLHSGSWIIRATAKLHYDVQVVFLPASTAVAPVCLDGSLNESVKEFVETFLSVSGDDELYSPFGKFVIMFFLAKSLLHLFVLLDRTWRHQREPDLLEIRWMPLLGCA
jgi:hypothetical protein